MSQRLFIQLIPVNVFIMCLLVGWLAVMGVQTLIAHPGVVAAAGLEAPKPAAGPVAGQLSPVFTPEVQHWSREIVAWSRQFGLDPNLAATVMQIESCGAPSVVSSAGAQGLFQVMPFHFDAGEAMQDPGTNAARGLAYLALGLEKAGGDVGLALAGYNGGHGVIGRESSQWSSQTQRYWYWGTGIYQAAASGAATSDRLLEWLQAGGAGLCATADEQLGLAQ